MRARHTKIMKMFQKERLETSYERQARKKKTEYVDVRKRIE